MNVWVTVKTHIISEYFSEIQKLEEFQDFFSGVTDIGKNVIFFGVKASCIPFQSTSTRN
jgi:hypothetical protein